MRFELLQTHYISVEIHTYIMWILRLVLSNVSKLSFQATVEFTADDFERDRDLLNSRASRLLLGIFGADDETDGSKWISNPYIQIDY